MENKARLIIRRKSEWVNRLRPYKVFIDGQIAGTVRSGESEEFQLTPGLRKIYCKTNWCTSREFEIESKDGEKHFLEVKSGMKFYPVVATALIAVLIYDIIIRYSHQGAPQGYNYVLYGVGGLALLYIIYYLTLGRKDYLVLGKDNKSPFAK